MAILLGIWEWIVAFWGEGNSHNKLASGAIILGVLLGVGSKAVQKWRHHRYRANLFKLWVPHAWPVPANAPIKPTAIEMDFGETKVLVGVVPGSDTVLGHFDLRFVSSKQGGNIDPKTIRIVSVADRLRQKTFLIPGEIGDMAVLDLWATRSESTGGMDCYYMPPLPADGNRTIWLNVTFEAAGPWQGYLSFRGRDRNEHFVPPSCIHIRLSPPPFRDLAES